MDYKKIVTEQNAVTRNTLKLEKGIDNIYETTVILSKRAEQIAIDLKKEFTEKVSEFQSVSDTLEEVYENREQIEVARFYERMPKPTIIAINELINSEIYHRNPIKEGSKDNF